MGDRWNSIVKSSDGRYEQLIEGAIWGEETCLWVDVCVSGGCLLAGEWGSGCVYNLHMQLIHTRISEGVGVTTWQSGCDHLPGRVWYTMPWALLIALCPEGLSNTTAPCRTDKAIVWHALHSHGIPYWPFSYALHTCLPRPTPLPALPFPQCLLMLQWRRHYSETAAGS